MPPVPNVERPQPTQEEVELCESVRWYQWLLCSRMPYAIVLCTTRLLLVHTEVTTPTIQRTGCGPGLALLTAMFGLYPRRQGK